jgi:hypothetical protein
MDDYEMTSLRSMTPEEFRLVLIGMNATCGYLYNNECLEILARLREREAAMEIVEHWKFSPAADWSAETQSFAAGVLLSAMQQAARRGKS